MRVDSWQLVIYEGQTSTVRDQMNSDARASRLKALDFELRASPFGPTCWDMNFTSVQGIEAEPIRGALLDTVKLYLNGENQPRFTGRISKLPGFDATEMQFLVQGQYRLAKTVFQSVPIHQYTGAMWPKVKEALDLKLGVGNVIVPDDPTVQVENWSVEDKNLKLDAFVRMISDLLGGGIAAGFRADGKFVMGRSPLEPTRTLGVGVFEPREARLANRLYIDTGYDPGPLLIVEEQASLLRDGPLEESENLGALIRRNATSFGKTPVTVVSASVYTPLLFTPNDQMDDYTFGELTWVFPKSEIGVGLAPTYDENVQVILKAVGDGQEAWLASTYLTKSYEDPPGKSYYLYKSLAFTARIPGWTTAIRVDTVVDPGEIFNPLLLNESTLTGTLVRMDKMKEAAENLFAEKYGPTLKASATLPDEFEPPGGRGRYRYADGQEALLIDYSAKYSLQDGRFTTVLTGGSKTRYNAAQLSRRAVESVSSNVDHVKAVLTGMGVRL